MNWDLMVFSRCKGRLVFGKRCSWLTVSNINADGCEYFIWFSSKVLLCQLCDYHVVFQLLFVRAYTHPYLTAHLNLSTLLSNKDASVYSSYLDCGLNGGARSAQLVLIIFKWLYFGAIVMVSINLSLTWIPLTLRCRHLLHPVLCYHHAEHQSSQSKCEGQARRGTIHLHEQRHKRRRRLAWRSAQGEQNLQILVIFSQTGLVFTVNSLWFRTCMIVSRTNRSKFQKTMETTSHTLSLTQTEKAGC